MIKTRIGQLLIGMLAFFLMTCGFASGAAGEHTAAFVGGVTATILHGLHSFSLVIGLICLLLAVDRFKKYRHAPGEVSLSAAVLYIVFGVILLVTYFCW